MHTWVWFGFTFLQTTLQDHCGAEPGTGRNDSWMQCVYFHTSQAVQDERCWDYEIPSTFCEQDVIIRLELMNVCQTLW